LGYGTWGSGFYIDPGNEPLRFLGAALERAPILLLGQWGFPPSIIYVFLSSGSAHVMWIGGLCFLALVGVVLAPLFRQDPVARFWGLGMVLSLLPICATKPHDRLFFFTGLGAMGLLGRFVDDFFSRSEWLSTGRSRWILARGLALLFVGIHGVLAPLLLPLNVWSPAVFESMVKGAADGAPMNSGVEEQRFVIVNPPSAFFAQYLPAVRIVNSQPNPRHIRVLASGIVPMEITRRDARALVVKPEGGFLTEPLDVLFRGRAHPMARGQVVEVAGMQVEVLELTGDGRPAEASFRFDVSLEDPHLRWLQWKEGGYAEFTPPAIGETAALPAALPAAELTF
jgi:hypothetical protein